MHSFKCQNQRSMWKKGWQLLHLPSKSYIENLFLVHFIISIKSISVSEMQHRTHRAQSGKGCLLLLENSKFCGEQETTSFRCHWRQAPYKWAIYRWQLQMERTVLRTRKIVPAAALSIPSSYWGNSVRTLIISCRVFVSALKGKCYLCLLSCPKSDQHYFHHKSNYTKPGEKVMRICS